MRKVGGGRNFGWGKQMEWAGKQALRAAFGGGHYGTNVRITNAPELGDPDYWDDWSAALIVRRGNLEDYERKVLRYRQKGQKMINATASGIFPS